MEKLNWFERLWFSDWNIIRMIFEASLCVKKNDKKEFSIKKCLALIISGLAIGNHAGLHFDASNHWVVTLSTMKVGNSITIALIASLDALAAWALAIYVHGKINNAA